MNLELLTQPGAIENAANSLFQIIKQGKFFGEPFINFPGGPYRVEMYYQEKYDFWTSYGPNNIPSPCHWFSYGMGIPPQQPSKLIHICHTTIPKYGINLRYAGAFARDGDDGTLYLMHSGKFCHVCKEDFIRHYGTDRFVNVATPNSKKIPDGMMCIGPLDPEKLLKPLFDFVGEVKKIKAIIAAKKKKQSS